jgi:hypothetical protein
MDQVLRGAVQGAGSFDRDGDSLTILLKKTLMMLILLLGTTFKLEKGYVKGIPFLPFFLILLRICLQ